jgi:aspartokinase
MKKSALYFLLVAAGMSACSRPRPVSADSQQAKVPVATVPGVPGVLTNVLSALTEAGIPFLASGSSTYVIQVSPNKKSQAIEILKRDAQLHKYDVTVY